jgi:predicted DCC family thiol-disulfide oxidoreductase YuxK
MVALVLKNERDHSVYFCAHQSDKATEILSDAGFKNIDPETMYFFDGGKVFDRSDAALQLARHLRWYYRWLRIFRFVPKKWRDFLYDFVAKRRMKLRKGFCVVPDAGQRFRFLS